MDACQKLSTLRDIFKSVAARWHEKQPRWKPLKAIYNFFSKESVLQKQAFDRRAAITEDILSALETGTKEGQRHAKYPLSSLRNELALILQVCEKDEQHAPFFLAGRHRKRTAEYRDYLIRTEEIQNLLR